ncbi:hypothetical protein [Bacteroides sp. 224]|uniref:hypothetical protein n=1 Tax=Bacteroides sp. 224 TaxID=2302936 RepID=UPI00194030E8|nr:hypothetical protein [Bacteroides sp. 224]
MEDVLGSIYCWFESLFGQNLANYLWGYDCATQGYSNPNIFNSIGLIALAVSFVSTISYYYIINHPRFNRLWSWLLVLVINGIANLLIGYYITATDFANGTIGDCLMHTRDEAGNIISWHIFETDCWMFGVSNLIVSTGFFILFSLIIIILGRLIPQLASRNCKYSPF